MLSTVVFAFGRLTFVRFSFVRFSFARFAFADRLAFVFVLALPFRLSF